MKLLYSRTLKRPLTPEIRQRLDQLVERLKPEIPGPVKTWWDRQGDGLNLEALAGKGRVDFSDGKLQVLARVPLPLRWMLTSKRKRRYIADLEAVLTEAGI